MASVLFWYDYDWPGAENEFRRAIELNPNLGEAYEFDGWYQTCAGSREEGVAVGRKAVAVDPLSINALEMLSQDLYLTRQYPEAEQYARRALEIFPRYWIAHVHLALIQIAQGRSRDAIAAAQSARQDEPLVDWTTAVLGMAYAADGQPVPTEKVLADLNAKAARGWVPSYAFAEIYAGLHDQPQTLAALEKAYEERAWFLTYLNTAPEFDFLRTESRFQALLRKMNFPG